MSKLLVDDLLSSVKSRTLAPTGQPTWTDSQIIDILNEEMYLHIVPMIQKVREDYFLRVKRQALTASKDNYRLPQRALGNTLKDLFYVDDNGNKYPMARTKVRDIEADGSVTGLPQRYIIQGDEIILVPTPTSVSGNMDIYYPRRPNKLVATSRVAKITAISDVAGTCTFTVDTDLSSILSSGDLVDVISVKSSPYMEWAEDVSIDTITSSTIAVSTSSVVDDDGSTVLPQVNDYICVAGETNVPMMPEEFHPIVAQSAAVYILEALGDIQKYQVAQQRLAGMTKAAMDLITNRVESSVRKINNRHGILSSNTYYGNRRLSGV